MNALAANWKTTLCGVLILLDAVGNKILIPFLDSDPATSPDFEFARMFILAGLALLFSADGSKLQQLLNTIKPAAKAAEPIKHEPVKHEPVKANSCKTHRGK